MKYPLTLALVCAPASLLAEVSQFQIGQYLTITGSYLSESHRFTTNVPDGEQGVCFHVDAVTAEGITLSLVRGVYRPWWNDKKPYTPEVGYTDVWSTSTAYKENQPTASALDELKGIFTAHSACP